MWRRVARQGGLVLALLVPPTAASAQQSEPTRGPPRQAELSSGSLEAAPHEAARFEAALREADRRFVSGDLRGALAVLQPVCIATDSAECAFSLGAIQHGLGNCPEALAHYRRYLQLAPRGEHLAEVSAALEEVEGRCGSARAPAPSLASSPLVSLEPPPAPEPSTAASPAPLPSAAASPAPLLVPAPPAPVEPSALARGLTTAAFVMSGAAALSGAVFGVLAARSVRRCERADAYDQRFIDECEVRGPRYQGLWQGSAIASGAFLGVGVALWWSSSRAVSARVSGVSWPGLALHGRF